MLTGLLEGFLCDSLISFADELFYIDPTHEFTSNLLRTHIYSSIGPSLLDMIFRLLTDEGAWPCGQASHFDKPILRVYDRSITQL